MGKILIVDDDAQLRHSFEKILTAEGHKVLMAATGESGLEIVKNDRPEIVVMDVRLPGMGGLEAFKAMHEVDAKLPVIIMTAYGTTDTAIEATKLGAFDYLLKPFDIPEMLSNIDKALSASKFMRSRVEIEPAPEGGATEVIFGRSKSMQEVYKQIGRVASTAATILIRGESGTGKELVARAIYQHSARANRPFLVINCVAIPETLLESELFGYEKGAFTGAVNRRIGKIEQANGGTVFLDEIGDMPFSIQAKILRLLQERSIERLGGRSPIPVDVRVIAATNRDLEAALLDGRFREDLYYRLKVVTLNLPPVRERVGDIPILAEYFLRRFSDEMGIDSPGLTDKAKEVMESYSWPGNVRELGNAVQKGLIFSRGAPICSEEISQAIKIETEALVVPPDLPPDSIEEWIKASLAAGGNNLFVDMVDQFSKILMTQALLITGGNRSQAAKLLGLSRPTLLAKIEKYRIKIEASIKGS